MDLEDILGDVLEFAVEIVSDLLEQSADFPPKLERKDTEERQVPRLDR